MTRLSRLAWWTVLVTALAGLLLSLVVLLRPPAVPAQAAPVEIAGAAALGVPGSRVAPDRRTATEERIRAVVQRAKDKQQKRTTRAARDRARPPRIGRQSAEPPRVRRVVAPARLRVPSVQLDLAVRPTGVGRAGQMALPTDPRILGWYRYGPAPRSGSGSAVLAGHVDSRQYGVGPLASLAAVRPGARVVVELRNGRRAAYRVDSIQRFDRQALPAGLFARGGPERLRLVTCIGAFLPEAGGYQENLVVTAVPVGGGS